MIALTSVIYGTVSRDAELDALLAGVAARDTGAFARLYEQTRAAVFAYALSLLKSPHEAEDVLHDCYVSLYAAATGYTSAGKPMAWIITIARNLCLKRLQERGRYDETPWEELELFLQANPALSAEDRLLVQTCLAQLSEQERQIVLLHVVSGLKHREIAGVLGLALPTVLSKYHRALKKMKQHLGREEENR